MNKYYKIFFAITMFLMVIFVSKLSYEYMTSNNIKQQTIRYEAKTLADLIVSFREVYLKIFIEKHLNIDESNIDFLPVKTTNDIAELFSKYNVRVKFSTVSTNPRNPLNSPNTRQKKIIEKFNSDKNLPYIFEYKNNKYYYSQPLYIDNYCLKCHGNKKDAPKLIQDRYDKAYDYKLGELRGVIDIELDKTYISGILDKQNTKRIFFASILLCSIILLLFIYTRYFVKLNEKIEKQHENETKTLLDVQPNFVMLTNGNNVSRVNKTLLNFFGYKNIEDFKKDQNCICDFFLKEEGYLQKEQNGKSWLDILCEDFTKPHRVKIKDLKGYEKIFQVAARPLKLNDQYIISFTDISENIRKDYLLFEQSKMAAMGEMIANIAHQWRQPLSVITASASGIQVQKENGLLNDEILNQSLNGIINKAQYLSQTIDIFRNFIKDEKVFKEVILQDRIDKALEIVNTSLKNHFIELKNNIDYTQPIKYSLVTGEFSQVIINIINNAKDALVEKKIANPWVKIDLKRQRDKIIVTIEDNAGGIPNSVLPHIFEPYFTTKHKSVGTGLGLHMSYKIITESMKGKIYAKNTGNGAKFTIELPS